MLKKLNLDTSSLFKFCLKYAFFSALLLIIPFLVVRLVDYKIDLVETKKYETTIISISWLSSWLFITVAFYLYRFKSEVILTWFGFIKLGSLVGLFNCIIFSTFLTVFRLVGGGVAFGVNIFFFLLAIAYSVIVGIFFEKASFKSKIKRLVTVVIFVWGIYIFIRRLMDSSKSGGESYGVDTDGDGIKDSFDTNGDGMIDTKFIDSDGDGISDMIAMDTNKDGTIDTVALDINRDGKIDSIITKKA